MADENDQIILRAFGQALKELREAQNLTQQELSDLSNVDRSYISKMELAKKTASIISVFKLSGTLKASPGEILALAEKKLKSGDKKK